MVGQPGTLENSPLTSQTSDAAQQNETETKLKQLSKQTNSVSASSTPNTAESKPSTPYADTDDNDRNKSGNNQAPSSTPGDGGPEIKIEHKSSSQNQPGGSDSVPLIHNQTGGKGKVRSPGSAGAAEIQLPKEDRDCKYWLFIISLLVLFILQMIFICIALNSNGNLPMIFDLVAAILFVVYSIVLFFYLENYKIPCIEWSCQDIGCCCDIRPFKNLKLTNVVFNISLVFSLIISIYVTICYAKSGSSSHPETCLKLYSVIVSWVLTAGYSRYKCMIRFIRCLSAPVEKFIGWCRQTPRDNNENDRNRRLGQRDYLLQPFYCCRQGASANGDRMAIPNGPTLDQDQQAGETAALHPPTDVP